MLFIYRMREQTPMKDSKESLLDIRSFLDTSFNQIPIIDVRSPSEFSEGHIPGSYSVPLFTDDERCEVGILYKKEGQLKAVRRGLEIVGPKMASFADRFLELSHQHQTKCLRILCWRGGMRSESMGWLATRVGLSPLRLQGGYKSYRKFVLDEIDKPRNTILIGGYTGSGKTEVLQEISKRGIFPVLDLEEVAQHKGSAFGGLPGFKPITQEQFENELALKLSQFPHGVPYLVEDESRMIGSIVIPEGIWRSMQSASFMFLLSPSKEERVKRIVRDYGVYSAQWLISCIEKIAKKRGGQKTKEDIALIEQGDLESCASSLLDYYDQAYQKSVEKRRSNGTFLIKECHTLDQLVESLKRYNRVA